MTTEDFLDVLQQRRLVPDDVLTKLRAKATQGDSRVTPQSVLKFLVKKQLVTQQQAKDLLQTTLSVPDKAESSILGLAALPEQPPEPPTEPESEEILELQPLPEEENAPGADFKTPAKPSKTSSAEDDAPVAEPAVPTGSLFDDAFPEAKLAANEFDALPDGGRALGKKKRRQRTRGKQNEWDSPLLLLGGGGLVLLLVGGALIYYLLVRENSDAVLKQAEDFFAGGSYTQAERSYRHFVENWPNHPQYSQAKVRLGMTRLRMKTEGAADFSAALQTAQDVLDDIQDEDAFADDSETKSSLSSLLTAIAEGLAGEADASQNADEIQERVEQAKQALALTANTKFVPTRFLLKDRLDPVRATLDRVELRLQQNVDLAAALTEIDQAIEAADPAKAHEVRRQLIKKYHGLRDDEQLAAKVLEIAAAEQATVRFAKQELTANSAPRESPIVASLSMAESTGNGNAGEGTAVFRIDGALYGLNLSNGKLLWRRFVGFQPSTRPLVTPSHVFVGDAHTGELVCIESQNGEFVWRLPLDDELATPVVWNGRLLVSGRSGKLHVVDQVTGALLGVVQFSQPLSTPPTVDPRGGRIYQVGVHSNLYTLSADDLACLGVYYLGHAFDAVAAPPVVVANKVLVANNFGAETSSLHMLTVDEKGAVNGEASKLRLNGLVVSPLAVRGRRIAAATTSGHAVVYDIGAGDGEGALVKVATRDRDPGPPAARFAWLGEKHLWVAGNDLTKFAIRPAANRLAAQSLDRDYSTSIFDQQLRPSGGAVIHVRRSGSRAGVLVSAMDRTQGQTLWETSLAVPLAGAPAFRSADFTITAATSDGAVYRLDRDAINRRVADETLRAESPMAKPLTTAVALDNGGQAAGAVGAARLLHVAAGQSNGAVNNIDLPGELTSELITWGDCIVAPTAVGQVHLFDAANGSVRAAPFQPAVAPGSQFRWQTPFAVGTPEDGALWISDSVKKIFRVEMVDEPRPHLEATMVGDLDGGGIATRLAIAGESLMIGDPAGQVLVYSIADLEPVKSIQMEKPIAWGPYAVADGVILTTTGQEIAMLESQGTIRWRRALAHGPLAGAPLVDGPRAAMTCRNGGIVSINLADGQESSYVDLQQPLTSGPVVVGPRWAVAASDGTILVVDQP